MKTLYFGFTVCIATMLPLIKILQYPLHYLGMGDVLRMYGPFWKQFSPSAYISTMLLVSYLLSFIVAYVLIRKLDLVNRLPQPLAGKWLIWVGGVIMILPGFLRIFTSMIQGGGVSFALMSVALPFVIIAKVVFYVGLFKLLLAIKPGEQYSFQS